ncbi:MAG: bifunctional DNA-binding transcriptional regulator/O6-methylguanine-DNA methyltransferase Ada [Alphaproteobacteria bacterium]|nr:bifunctional DNA-binding transcriptional regulator/O6-methylguanine-DNA methyltransferase Ada [Alphaproteobacteria bacterium]
MAGRHAIVAHDRFDADAAWAAVLARDAGADGRFVFAVASTGIYCRPSCPSRHAKRERVRFFQSPSEARAAGFRACKRCRPDQIGSGDPALAAVRRACRYLDQRALNAVDDGVPELAEIGRAVGLSPHHLHRQFKRLTGITPRQYWDQRRLGRLKAGLASGAGVSAALYAAGYGSSSRVYESANARLGMTPGRFARGAAGERIDHAIIASPLGRLLVAATTRGICFVALGDNDTRLRAELTAEFPAADIRADDDRLGAWAATLLRHLKGQEPHLELPVDVRATAFQRRVWDELARVPYGQTTTYAALARKLGRPSAQRAVGSACGANPVALIVPCHRALRSDGGLGGYRWGLARKEKLIATERKAAGRRD